MASHLAPISARPRLSDADLLAARLHYTQPELSIEGLNFGIPDQALDPVIVGYYDETPVGGRKANPSAPMIWCCHCQRQTHWNGRVIHDSANNIHIIGHDCGRAHYGDRFINVERAHRDERLRQSALARWTEIRADRDELVTEVACLLKQPELKTLERQRQAFARAAPRLFRVLQRIAIAGRSLEAEEQQRDTLAERDRNRENEQAAARYNALSWSGQMELRLRGHQPRADSSPVFRTVVVDLGILSGTAFLLDRPDIRSTAIDMRATLSEFSEADRNGTDTLNMARLSGILKAIRESARALVVQIAAVERVHQFFSPENLIRLERWCANRSDVHFARSNEGFILTGGGGYETLISSISPIKINKVDRINAAANTLDLS